MSDHAGEQCVRSFWAWLEQLAADSLYPGAPFPRKIAALAVTRLCLQVRAEHPTAALPRCAQHEMPALSQHKRQLH